MAMDLIATTTVCVLCHRRSHNRRGTATTQAFARLVFALGLITVACLGDAIAAGVPDSTKGGEVVGFVRLAGRSGSRPSIAVSKNKEICGRNVEDESLVVGPQGGLRYAVVTIEDVKDGKAALLEAGSALDNHKCRFVPHVQALSVGQFVYLMNTDPILHTYYAVLTSSRVLFNVALWPGRQLRKPMVYPGVVRITCSVHPWMSAYIVVTDGPYHAVTDAEGEYEITDVPAGRYTVQVWHELLGSTREQVEVKAGTKTQLDFTLTMPRGE
jgi:plastocyanin